MNEKPPARTGLQRLMARLPKPSRAQLAKVGYRIRWLLLRGLFVLGAFLFFLVILTGAAGWYTSRPQFCRSCHIMEPYYKSWEESSHKDVTCIECHFAPGFGGKIRGKMLGLVQLAKYVTASAGPRPAAEIPDASCLRSGCHETRLLSGQVDFHGIPFDHRPHLSDIHRDKRNPDSPAFKLRCTSCHSQIVQGKHMTVTTSTCFLCHFKDGHFNQGPGACTHCHQVPDKEFDLGGGVMFNHDWATRHGIECINCHGDLIRGKGDVPREQCRNCHNREGDLERIGDVEFMHQKHVSDHKIDCLQCHLQIQHSLDVKKIEHAAADCASCHPNHHFQQVEMLRGTGALSIPAEANAMLAVRVECRTCHKIEASSPTGITWKGSSEVCTTCHEPAAAPKLRAYEAELKAALEEMDAVAGRARLALKSAKLADDRKKAIAAELQEIEHDLKFLQIANGIHNIHYAGTLTATLLKHLAAVCGELKIGGPKATLPQKMEGFGESAAKGGKPTP